MNRQIITGHSGARGSYVMTLQLPVQETDSCSREGPKWLMTCWYEVMNLCRGAVQCECVSSQCLVVVTVLSNKQLTDDR